MTPTRKSGRQPKPSTKLKEYLYDNEIEKAKEPATRTVDKSKISKVARVLATRVTVKKKGPQATKQTAASPGPEKRRGPQIKKEPESEPPAVKRRTYPVKKEPEPPAVKKRIYPIKKEPVEPRVGEKRKISQVTKEPVEPRVGEKRKISQVTKESPSDAMTPSRKSRRTPKPSAKLEEFVYDDDREKSVERVISKKIQRESEKPRKNIKIKEEIEDYEEEEEEDEDDDSDSYNSATFKKKQVKKPAGRENTVGKTVRQTTTSNNNSESAKKKKTAPQKISNLISSPRARVTSLTSIAAKKERKGAAPPSSQLTVRKGRIYTTLKPQTDKPVVKPVQKKTPMSLMNRQKRVADLPKENKKFVKGKPTPRITEKNKKSLNKMEENSKENKHKVEKKEIEKVLQVNKEVMTQLLNFGAEVAEAMACNNESIFSFSTKDNPLQTFKIDKQDDFSDEEVVKIIKWFEEEEEQRRAYRKRILEALRASHETNMSLYTQMLKMLQSVTTC